MTDRLFNTLSRRCDNRVSDKYTFTAKDGRPRKYARTAISEAFKRAGIKNFRIHDLRHTTASRLIQNGLTLFEVAQILSHSSSNTTARSLSDLGDHSEASGKSRPFFRSFEANSGPI